MFYGKNYLLYIFWLFMYNWTRIQKTRHRESEDYVSYSANYELKLSIQIMFLLRFPWHHRLFGP